MTENEMLQEICDVLNDSTEHKIGKRIIRVFKNYMEKVLDKKDVELNTKTLSIFLSAIIQDKLRNTYYKYYNIDTESIQIKYYYSTINTYGYKIQYKYLKGCYNNVSESQLFNLAFISNHKENHSCLKTLSKILLPDYTIKGFDENHKCYKTDEIIKEERKQFNR